MMLELTVTQDDGSSRVVRCLAPPVLLGRGKDCDLPLRSWRVARQHARLYVQDGAIGVDDLGSLTGTLVNGQRVLQQGGLGPDDEILVGSFRIQVRCCDAPQADADIGAAPHDVVHADGFLRAPGPAAPAPAPASADVHARSHDTIVADASAPGRAPSVATRQSASPALPEEIRQGNHVCRAEGVLRDALQTCRDDAEAQGTAFFTPDGAHSPPCVQTTKPSPLHSEWRRRLHARLLEAIDLRRRDVASMSDVALRSHADALLCELVEQARHELPAELDGDALRREVVDEAVGLGPLEALLADPAISEIMVNRHDEIFVEQAGRLHRHPIGFSSERAVLGVIERIVAPLGRRIDESSPMVDARLKDGSRVNAVIAPVALKGAALTIRKFPTRRLTVDDLVRGYALDLSMAGFLQLCVRERRNIVVSGGTGSGKTTLLNVLSNFVPPGERIVTIEDAAELRLHHAHLVSLEARPANLEGRGSVTIRDLVRNALRMRPDRIVVGECRGAEALDMLQAMNTGHEGSLTTLHANTPRDALARLETMILMAGMDLPLAAIREQVVSSVDLIVQQARHPDGARRITSIVEVAGIESGRVQLQELFRFTLERQGARFCGCGVVPAFYEEWRARGIVERNDWFFGCTEVPGHPAAGGHAQEGLRC